MRRTKSPKKGLKKELKKRKIYQKRTKKGGGKYSKKENITQKSAQKGSLLIKE